MLGLDDRRPIMNIQHPSLMSNSTRQPGDLLMRPYSEGDIAGILAVVRAREAAYHLGVLPDAEELERIVRSSNVEASRSAVAVGRGAHDGELSGAGCFMELTGADLKERHYILYLWTRPGDIEINVEGAFLGQLLTLIRENEACLK